MEERRSISQISSQLLPSLSPLGYTDCNLFYFSDLDPSSLFLALSLSISLHTSKNYPHVTPSLYSSLWQQKLPQLSSIAIPGSLSGPNPDLIVSAFLSDMRALLGEHRFSILFSHRRIPEKTDFESWSVVVDALGLFLTWYELTPDGVITHYYPGQKTEESVRIYVNLAQEGPVLYLLHHQHFEQPPSPGFPFYMESQGSRSGWPRPLDPSLINEPACIDSEAINTAKYNLQSALISDILRLMEGVESVRPGASRYQEALKGIIHRSGVIRKSEFAGGVLRVANLPISAEKRPVPPPPRPPVTHTVLNCELFPGQETVKHGNHIMHKSCLKDYLMLNDPERKYLCPICKTTLHKRLIDELLADITGSTFPPKPMCVGCYYCRRMQSKSMLVKWKHGCEICYPCCSKLQFSRSDCCVCQSPLSEEDVQQLIKVVILTVGK